QQPAVIEALVRGLEKAGLAACAVLDTGEGLRDQGERYQAVLQELAPEAAIHTCHTTDTLEMREALGIPHLHSIFFRKQSIEERRHAPHGLDPQEIVFQIAGQEPLGAIEPQVGAGTLHGGGSEEAMTPIADRIDHLVKRTKALVDLRRAANAEKRVAIVYWDK